MLLPLITHLLRTRLLLGGAQLVALSVTAGITFGNVITPMIQGFLGMG